MWRIRVLLCSFPLVLSPALQAQWVPLTANVRETTTITREGVVTESRLREGVYFRTANGSTLTHWTKIAGAPTPGTGSLLDNQELVSYQLDYEHKKARQGQFAIPQPLTPDLYAHIVSLGKDLVAGIPCDLVPVKEQMMDSPPERVGEACVSAKYGLQLKQDISTRQADGTVAHIVTEMFDVKLNVEPNPSEFNLGGNWEVIKPEKMSPPPTLDDPKG